MVKGTKRKGKESMSSGEAVGTKKQRADAEKQLPNDDSFANGGFQQKNGDLDSFGNNGFAADEVGQKPDSPFGNAGFEEDGPLSPFGNESFEYDGDQQQQFSPFGNGGFEFEDDPLSPFGNNGFDLVNA